MNELQYIPHAAIDKDKWDQAIHGLPLPGVYASSTFLDCMHPGWDALIWGNYEALMPVTHRRKWGIRYLCQPPFAQQIGVLGLPERIPGLTPLFLSALQQRYRLIEIFLHEASGQPPGTTPATNYVLPLRQSYQHISQLYKKDLHKNLQRCSKFQLLYVPETNFETAINLYRDTYGKQLGYADQAYAGLKKFCSLTQPEVNWLVRSVYKPPPTGSNAPPELLAIGLFLKDTNRIYNIASTTLPNGRMMEANHFLFDQLIQEMAGRNLILDFEGSDLPGVARFYQKFSPQNQPYFFYQYHHLPGWLLRLKKLIS